MLKSAPDDFDKVKEETNADAAQCILNYFDTEKQKGNNVQWITSMYNNKGGVLKSTCTAEIGYMMADLGINVLLVDMDSQCSLTENLLEIEEPVDKINFNERVIYNGKHLDCEKNVYSVFDGLTWMREDDTGSNLYTVRPIPITPLKLRSRSTGVGTAEPLVKRQKCSPEMETLKTLLKGSKTTNTGSIHLVIGHHNTSSISEKLSKCDSSDVAREISYRCN